MAQRGESHAYDAVGNLTSQTDRKGQTIQYVYDALNRLTQKSYPDSTSVDYVYDLLGKISQVTDPTGTYGFAYDNMGRLIGTTTQYAFLPATSFSNTYTYDVASNRKTFQYTGQGFDSETGLRYYRARYYDPTSGSRLAESHRNPFTHHNQRRS